uniref:CAHS 8b n=1 Tax=Macrobiotus joannae TaxID=947161 RepID=A0AAE9W6I6_9BILA|nr:CAHS 8b [Macrobiotus joannae]
MPVVENISRDAMFVAPEQSQDYEHRYLEQSDAKHTSYTHTEVKAPLMNLPTPFISSSMGLAQQLVGEGFQASMSRISGASEEFMVGDFPEIEEEARKDCDAKQREQDLMAQMFEKELQRKTEAYRKQQEIETERIRKELEKQHLRDVEFRKELMEQAIENQKRQIELEAKYAKKELERERLRARMTLDKSKFHTDIRVSADRLCVSFSPQISREEVAQIESAMVRPLTAESFLWKIFSAQLKDGQ